MTCRVFCCLLLVWHSGCFVLVLFIFIYSGISIWLSLILMEIVLVMSLDVFFVVVVNHWMTVCLLGLGFWLVSLTCSVLFGFSLTLFKLMFLLVTLHFELTPVRSGNVLINYLRVCCIFSQCVTPWYNHPGWPGIKNPSYLHTQSVYQRLKEEIHPKYQDCETFADTHNYLYWANWGSKSVTQSTSMVISGWELTETDNKSSYSYTGLSNLSEKQNQKSRVWV